MLFCLGQGTRWVGEIWNRITEWSSLLQLTVSSQWTQTHKLLYRLLWHKKENHLYWALLFILRMCWCVLNLVKCCHCHFNQKIKNQESTKRLIMPNRLAPTLSLHTAVNRLCSVQVLKRSATHLVFQPRLLCAFHAVHFKHTASWLQIDGSTERIKNHRKRTFVVPRFVLP